MKTKKILAIMIVLMMTLSLMPTMTFAEEKSGNNSSDQTGIYSDEATVTDSRDEILDQDYDTETNPGMQDVLESKVPLQDQEPSYAESSVYSAAKELVIQSNQTEKENNDYLSSANTITISTGNTITGKFDKNWDKDWFKFTLDQGTIIDLDIMNTETITNLNSGISTYICDSNNTDEAEFISFQTSGYNSNLGYFHYRDNLYLEKGTYYIYLTSYSKVTYKMSIITATTWGNIQTSNNYLGQAYPVSLDTVYQGMMATYNSRGKIYNDSDYFAFNVPATDTYILTFRNYDMKGDWISSPTVEALDANGNSVNTINGQSYMCAYEGKTESVRTVLNQGTVYFSITPGWYQSSGCGRYEFSISKPEQTAVTASSTDLPSVKIFKPKAAKKTITVRWKKVSTANQKKITGIQIQYSRDKYFRTGVKIKTAKKNAVSKKIKGLKSKKTYWVRARTYRKDGNDFHVSKWSKEKKIKVK